MANLTIKGVPDELLDTLRRSAQANRRSINSEVLLRLERSAGLKPIDAEERIARVQRLHERYPIPPLTDELLVQARSEGRP